MAEQKYFLTTPIYYVNFKPHIGTSYSTVLTDVISRFQRFRGRDVLMVTGSDEHSQNIADLAAAAGKAPRAYCDEIIPKFLDCWKLLNIQNFCFERTSDEKHHLMVQKFWQRVLDNGDVYKGEYAGWYHTTDNRFLDPDEVPEKPEEHPRLRYLKEDAYFFRLSRYQDWLTKLHDENPELVVPDFRRTEIVNRIRGGLRDVCISRTSITWGIPLPWDRGHVFYVWVDALLTYLTGSGFDIDAYLARHAPAKQDITKPYVRSRPLADLTEQPAGNYWPADMHVMAKDIPWFHAVIWPAMLESFGLEAPKKILVHGYWQFGGEKMSKSLGNVVDPYDAAKLVGADGLRYFLMREVPAGRDGTFNYDVLVKRYNFDLVNDLGNLVHRSLSLLHQLYGGVVPELADPCDDTNDELEACRRATISATMGAYEELRFSDALQQVWALVSLANRYVATHKPWELKQNPRRADAIARVFHRLLAAIRTITLLAYPVIPEAANRFWKMLNLTGTLEDQREAALNGAFPPGHRVAQSEVVFQRTDRTVLEQLATSTSAATDTPATKSPSHVDEASAASGTSAQISIDDFGKIDLRVVEIRAAERVDGSDKLLKLVVFDGTRERQVVSGIAKWYAPEELVGLRLAMVANLKPAKLRGLVSEGMLLCGEDEHGNLSVVGPLKSIGAGAKIR